MGYERVTLGRTGLSVCPLGIASSYGADAAMIEEAYEHGVNYFYWGAMRTKKMAEGIRNVAKKNRDDAVIVAHTNAVFAFQLPGLVEKSLKQLGVDYIDVLILGWRNNMPAGAMIDQCNELKERGLVRFTAISSHNRLIFKEFEKEKLFDIFHIRYNAAHRGAEKEILPYLSDTDSPGIVSFTSTRWGGLIHPGNMPQGEAPPTAGDCYRFVIAHPKVHVAVCGPNSMEQLRQNLKIIEQGPMNEEELERMRYIGEYVYKNSSQIKDNLRGLSTIKLRGSK